MPLRNTRWAKRNTMTGMINASMAPDWMRLGRVVVQSVESAQAHCDRLQFGSCREVDQGLEEIIPGEVEMKKGYSHDRGFHLGEEDRPHRAERAGAIDGGCFVELLGDGEEDTA